MANRNTNEKEKNRMRKDVTSFRMSLMFFLACAVIFFILKLDTSAGRLGVDIYKFLKASPAFFIVSGILFALAAAFFIYMRVKKADESLKTFTSTGILGIFAYIFFASLYFRFIGDAKSLLIATIAVFVLYYISHFYKTDFFFFALSNALNLWVLRSFVKDNTAMKIITPILAVGFLAYVLYYMLTKNKSGRLLLYPIFISALISLALFLCEIFGVISPLVVLIIFVSQLIIAAVIYTIRLIREV